MNAQVRKIGIVVVAAACFVLLVVVLSNGSSADPVQTGASSAAPDAGDALQRNQKRWQAMTDARRDALRNALDVYAALPPDRQRELRRRYRWYEQLPRAEQRLVRANFELIASATKKELATLKRIYTLFQQLPPDKQERVNGFYRQWRKRPVADQRKFLERMRGAHSFKQRARIAREWLHKTKATAPTGEQPVSPADGATPP